MTKLDDAILHFQNMRTALSAAHKSLGESKELRARTKDAYTAALETVVAAEAAVERAKSRMRGAAERIGPLLHTEVAGSCATPASPTPEPQEEGADAA